MKYHILKTGAVFQFCTPCLFAGGGGGWEGGGVFVGERGGGGVIVSLLFISNFEKIPKPLNYQTFQTKWDITVASEIMAVLALATDLSDLKSRYEHFNVLRFVRFFDLKSNNFVVQPFDDTRL